MIVKYRRLYPYAPYLNEEIGFEISIPDDGDPIAEVQTLKELADKAHAALNPSLPIQEEAGQPKEIPVIDRRKETLREIIADCNTVEELIKIKDDVWKYGLLDMYTDKLDYFEKQSLGLTK